MFAESPQIPCDFLYDYPLKGVDIPVCTPWSGYREIAVAFVDYGFSCNADCAPFFAGGTLRLGALCLSPFGP